MKLKDFESLLNKHGLNITRISKKIVSISYEGQSRLFARTTITLKTVSEASKEDVLAKCMEFKIKKQLDPLNKPGLWIFQDLKKPAKNTVT